MVPPIEYPKKVKQTDKKQTLSGSVTPTLQISNLFQLVLQMATKLQLKAGLAFTHWRDCSSKHGLGELGAGEGRRADDKSWDFHLPHNQY